MSDNEDVDEAMVALLEEMGQAVIRTVDVFDRCHRRGELTEGQHAEAMINIHFITDAIDTVVKRLREDFDPEADDSPSCYPLWLFDRRN
jgi:hypothetical protein